MSRQAPLRALVIGAGQIGGAVAQELASRGVRAIWLHCRTEADAEIAASRAHSTLAGGTELALSFGDVYVPVGPFDGDGLRPEKSVDDPVEWLRISETDDFAAESRFARLVRAARPSLVVEATTCATLLADPETYPELARHPLVANAAEPLRDSILHGLGVAALRKAVLAARYALTAEAHWSLIKVSTTALGGMGFDIPFTHGDRRDTVLSPALWRKLALSGVHHQLLWALARTFPGRVQLVVPAAAVGFEDDAPESFAAALDTTGDRGAVEVSGVRSGENSIYTLQEILLLCAPEQMGMLTKEEVAEAVADCAFGTASADVLAAMTSASLRPSLSGHTEWKRRIDKLRRAERDTGVVSLVSGNLGPAVSKDLVELHALLSVASSPTEFCRLRPDELAAAASKFLRERSDLAAQARAAGVGLQLTAASATRWQEALRGWAGSNGSRTRALPPDAGSILARCSAPAPAVVPSAPLRLERAEARHSDRWGTATMSSRVVVISDCTDIAFAEMRGAIVSNASGPVDIEPLVPTAAFSVVHASFVLRLMAEAYPDGTVLSVIMNSLQERTERLIGRTERRDLIFEGTNTGAFGWLLRDFGCREVYELHDPGFMPFGGKFVHAPSVGRAATGIPLWELGTPFPIERVRAAPIEMGTIVHVDNFGNVKFAYDLSRFSFGDELVASIGGAEIPLVYWKRMMEREDGEWVLYPGSSFGLAEIGQVRSRGFLDFRVDPGDRVEIVRAVLSRRLQAEVAT